MDASETKTLLAGAMEDAKHLVSLQTKLVKQEIAQEARRVGKTAVLTVGVLGTLFPAIALSVFAAASFISAQLDWPLWLAQSLVAGCFGLLSALFGYGIYRLWLPR